MARYEVKAMHATWRHESRTFDREYGVRDEVANDFVRAPSGNYWHHWIEEVATGYAAYLESKEQS